MALKDLLVHLDNGPANGHRLELAATLARRHGAHLTGLYVFDLIPSIEAVARGFPDQVQYLERYAQLRKDSLDRSSRIEAQFRDCLRRDGIQGEWRFIESLPAETVALHARYADLAIVGQIDPDHIPSKNAGRIPEEALYGSGRPVLIVPYAGRFQSAGDHVLVAWKATREAARAVNDALPLLQSAKKVTIVTVNPDKGEDVEPGIPAADIALHLAHHGVKVEAAATYAEDIGAADALLNLVSDSGVDLLVMGGYGHSRMREIALGGVTRQILQQMTVPVLMAH